ncbi:hypothetical protein LJC14_04260 [Treponema sp. OttesenSCG-928-L16]|nr:hypothetical protein [Treponema sp. OttesenSCG-928-L16]
MKHRMLLKAGLFGLTLGLFLSACDAFNLSIPEYIDKYTNTAAGGAYTLDGSMRPRYAGSSNNLLIAEPGASFSIDVILRNPRKYDLDPIVQIYGSSGSWEDYPGSTGIEALFNPPDHMELLFDASWPESPEIVRLRLLLKDRDSGRVFDDEPYELPSLLWSYSAREPQNIVSSGRTVSWTEAGNEGATKMTISWRSGASSGTYTYSRGSRSDGWAADNTSYPAVKKDEVDPDFSVNLPGGAGGILTGASYEVSITFSDPYSLTGSGRSAGTAPSIIYASGSGEGTRTGDDANNAIAFKDIDLHSVNGLIIEINLVGDISVTDIANTNPCVIPGTVSSMTIKPSGGDWEIELRDTGSLFTLGEGTTLVLGDSSSSYKLTVKGHENNTAPLIMVNSKGKLEMNAGVSLTGNTNTTASSLSNNGGGVHIGSYASFIMHGGTISYNAVPSDSSYTGGGVRVGSNASFTMKDGSILYNTGKYAVYICLYIQEHSG